MHFGHCHFDLWQMRFNDDANKGAQQKGRERQVDNNNNNINNSSDIFHLRHCHFESWLMRFYDNDDKDVEREGRGRRLRDPTIPRRNPTKNELNFWRCSKSSRWRGCI